MKLVIRKKTSGSENLRSPREVNPNVIGKNSAAVMKLQMYDGGAETAIHSMYEQASKHLAGDATATLAIATINES